MHQRFIDNILAGSRSRDFSEAVREWKIERYGASPINLNCHLCNTVINNFVVLRNTVNENRLVIGNDCYDKFIAFLRTGKVESQLPTRSEHVKAIRKHLQDIVPVMPRGKRNRTAVRTVIGWLEEQLEVRALPDEIGAIVETMKILGFTPSIEDAEKIVAYYKATRKLSLLNFIEYWELKRYGLNPSQEVTQDEFVEVNKRFEEARATAVERAKQERLEREALKEQEERVQWSEKRSVTITDFDKLKALFARVQSELPLIAKEITPSMEWLQKQVDGLPLEYPGLHAYINLEHVRYLPGQLISEIQASIRERSQKMEKLLGALSEEIVIVPAMPRYALRKENDRWTKIRSVIIENKEWPMNPGLYEVRYLGSSPAGWRGETHEHFVVAKEVPGSPSFFPVIDFSIPSTKHEGTFVGFLNRKVALPSSYVTESGKYLCFLMAEMDTYYRVWTIRKTE
jgi:uncharacterized protein YbcI